AVVFERLLVQSEAAAGLTVSTLGVTACERRQKVHRRLMVADRRQHTGEHDLDRTFRALIVVGRLLDVPLAPLRIGPHHARIRTVIFFAEERVRIVGLGRAFPPPWTVKQVPRRKIAGALPEFSERRLPWGHGRPYKRGARRRMEREKRRSEILRRSAHRCG